MLFRQIHFQCPGFAQRIITADAQFLSDGKPKPLIILAHGFKGFKDWGHFNLIGRRFAESGFVFVKFNFSHNGVTPEKPLDFADLEAFGRNNYSIELADYQTMIDFLFNGGAPQLAKETDWQRLFLIGHSRGGGDTIIQAAREPRVKKAAAWASVCRLAGFPEEWLTAWENEGVVYVPNARTKQQMPLYPQLLADFEANKEALSVENAVKRLKIPLLIVHGDSDPTVPLADAETLKRWQPAAKLVVIQGGDHVFNGKHPFADEALPPQSAQAFEATRDFFLAA